ncbi:MAG: hypothetical protein K8S16_13160, partial [Bacteroidales bacterium]|nr:hypothetical protein [Bacteroidales bacterium]
MKNFKLFFLFVALTFAGIQTFADDISLVKGKETKLTITENNYSNLRLTSSLSGLNYFNVKSPEGTFSQIAVAGYGYSMDIGNPRLPVLKKLIELPIDSEFEIKITKQEFQEFDLNELGVNFKIFPAQPSVFKNIEDPDDIEFIFNQNTYQANEFFQQQLVKVKHLGTMRSVTMARIEISPFQYNPVSNKIIVCTDLEVEIIFIGGDTGKTIEMKKSLFSPYFNGIYNTVSNYKVEVSDELITDEPVTYIIVSDPMFETALQPFIEWKTKKGFYVIEAYTDQPNVGTTTTSIKTYLEDLYNNPPTGYNAQSFVLFVGDVDQIPAFSGTSGSHVTDLYYCEYTGDIYPECYYGRFSAENLAELQPQIDKTLEYEQYLMPDPSFLDEALMVAGDDEGYEDIWGNGQINYGTTYYFNMAHGINSHTFLQDPPISNNAYHDSIIANMNRGITYGNYTAHCGSSGWGTPSFTNSDIPGLTNAHKYPLLVGNCCLSNRFNTDDCFGEELLMAVDKGAIGYIGGSNNTQWDEDFWWGVGAETPATYPVYNPDNLGAYDRTFHDNGEPLSQWCATQGQMPSAGNLAVTQAGGNETYYWEIYCLMGDPSVMIYMSQPPVTNATYAGLMPLGAATFTVNTEPYAYVGITKDGVLHGAAIADASGTAEVTMNPIISVPGTADVVVTRQNGQPYIGTVIVASPSGPYLLYNSHNIDDIAGNNNGEADYDEDILLDVTLENMGSDPATNVSATLSSTDTYVTITDDYNTWPDIPDGATSTQNGAFGITVSDDVPDQHIVDFDLEITGSSKDIWNSSFSITVNAPLLEFGSMTIDDNAGGDGNGRLDPGETADIYVPVSNNGHSLSPLAEANLSSLSGWITINSGYISLGQIVAGNTANALFNISTDPLTPIGTAVDLTVDVSADNYGISNTFYQSVGLVLEDWETGNFASFPWIFTGNADWFITNVDPYEGTYCAQSGAITHNQTSEMEVELNVTTADDISFYRKVSSESGWDYLRFYIDGTQQEQWSGEVAWSQVNYPVTTGLHTFKWVYYKDSNTSNGSDCGWVDYINFPPISPPPTPPNIEINPENFEVTLPPDDQTTQTLTISNIGEEVLDFSITKYYHPNKSSKAYCTSVGGGSDEFIENVTIGSINNTTVQSYYADYTSMSTVVVPGMSYPITITNGDPVWTSDQCGIWVDWNQNEDFYDDAPITVSGSPGVGPYTANIVPPGDAMPGPTRMRVQIIYSAVPDPCTASFTYGEVEDYTLVVDSDFTDWLTFTPPTGTIPGSDMTDIDVTFNSTDMEVGDYYADLIISSNDPVEP